MNRLETITLKNGLTIYLYKDARRHSTLFQFNTYCGGMTKHFKLDGKEYHIQDGVAHILEHYIVECNEKGNFLDELGKRQMATNASTSYFLTSYYFEAVENISLGIKTILEGVYNTTFETEKLERLKNPIYQEIRGKKDNKFYYANRIRMTNLFHKIDCKDVGGTLEEVEKTTIDDLKALYQAFYHPSNQFIVVAGNFNKQEVVKEIKNFYQSFQIPEHKVEKISLEEKNSVSKKEDILYFPTPMEYLEINFKIDISNYTNTELLDLNFYLSSFYKSSFGITSPLYKKLMEEKIILDRISYSDKIIKNYLIITIGSYTYDPKKLKEWILEEIKSPSNQKRQKFELDKKEAIMQIILREENIFKTIFPLIENIVYYHYPYLDTVEDVEKLTYEDYKNTIQKIDFSNYTTLLIKNKEH